MYEGGKLWLLIFRGLPFYFCPNDLPKMTPRFSFGSSRQSIESIDESPGIKPAYAAGADEGPSLSNPSTPKVSVSVYVREVVSGTCTVFQEMPVVSIVCKTLLSIEQLVGTAKGNRKELAVLLELCDVVTKGALNRWSEHPGPYEGLEALKRHVENAHRVAAMCNKGRFARLALSRKISRNIVTVKTNIVNFATLHNLVLSTALHVRTLFASCSTKPTLYLPTAFPPVGYRCLPSTGLFVKGIFVLTLCHACLYTAAVCSHTSNCPVQYLPLYKYVPKRVFITPRSNTRAFVAVRGQLNPCLMIKWNTSQMQMRTD